MDKHAVWKWLVLLILVSASSYFIIPLSKIPLGLDLRGGTSFTVQIDEERAREEIRASDEAMTEDDVDRKLREKLEGAQGRILEVLRNRVDALGIGEPIIHRSGKDKIIIQLPGIGEKERKEAEESIQRAAYLEFRMTHKRDAELVSQLFAKGLAPEGYRIVRIGNDMFYAREEEKSYREKTKDPEYRKRLSSFNVPDREYEFMLEEAEEQGHKVYKPHFVRRRTEMTGDYLEKAIVDYGRMGRPEIDITLDARGTKIFAGLTSDYAPGGAKNPGREYRALAIVLDGTLYSAPIIKEPIPNGRAVISGNFSVPEATRLANILNAGSLPVPVKIVERRIVAPSLGTDSVHSGVWAGVLGCALIAVAMSCYYLVPGLIATFALFLNAFLLPLGALVVAGFLDVFSEMFSEYARVGGSVSLPVLTLPGIAGIALTIGMAVDANVLIFERIREELRAGKGFIGAIQAGYERAFTAILDSNVTTIVTAVILFLLGAGPIRGFAVTLSAGLIVSLYTSVFVTRMCFNALAAKTTNTSVLKMASIFPQTNIDFVKWWKLACAASGAFIIGTAALMISKVEHVKDVEYLLRFQNEVSIHEVRKFLDERSGAKTDADYVRQGPEEGKMLRLVIPAGAQIADVASVLNEQFPDAAYSTVSTKELARWDLSKLLNIDFTGGSATTLGFKERVPVENIRSALKAAGIPDAVIQYQKGSAGGDKENEEDLLIKTGTLPPGASVERVLQEKFPEAGFVAIEEDDIGAQVGRDLTRKAVKAMLWALAAMLIYINIRFRFGFALGAVVALFHDVLVTMGACHLAGIRLSLTVVAALMTIAGYSVNDTIVIFDRIRENLKFMRNRSFAEVCNLSTNQTLSRTFLTTATTLLVVLSLLLFGGGAIKDFSFAMLVGMIVGTYSTIYIATPIVLLWYRFRTPEMKKSQSPVK